MREKNWQECWRHSGNLFIYFQEHFCFLYFVVFKMEIFSSSRRENSAFRDKYEQRRIIKMSVYNNYIFWYTFIRYEFILYIMTSVSYLLALVRIRTSILPIRGWMQCSIHHLVTSNEWVIAENANYEMHIFPSYLKGSFLFFWLRMNILDFSIQQVLIKRKLSVHYRKI